MCVFVSGLKPGRVIRVKWVTFLCGSTGSDPDYKISESDPDSALTALLEYFDL